MTEKTRRQELKEYVLHISSLSVSIALAQAWIAFGLRLMVAQYARLGWKGPSSDFRSLAVTTFVGLMLLHVFEMQVHLVPAGIGVSGLL